MRFYSVVMKGKFILQKLSSLLTFDSDRDKGRIVYVDDECTGYIGTPDGWVPITGVQKVNVLPNWRSCLIGRLFYLTTDQKLYIGTSSGFGEAGGAVTQEGEIDYSTAVCMLCTPPSGDVSINDTYVVCSSATEPLSGDAAGDWAGHENQLTVWDGSSWAFSDPTDYQRVLVDCYDQYQIWIADLGQWEIETQNSCFNFTSTEIYPKTDANIPPSGAFFEEDGNGDLMPVETLPGYINLTWEDFEGSALMPA